MGVRTVAWLTALCVWAAVATTLSGAPQLGQALPERQLPVFRTDSHFVRVDAYPTEKDGSITRGLAAEDFEITEDGKPQRLDSAEYIEYERWSPGIDPPSVETQRESYRLAADPRYRVVVVYVNRLSRSSARHIQQPLVDMLTREVGPRDLYGLLMPNHEASDLVLGKFTPAEQARLSHFLSILDHSSPFEMDPVEQKLFSCFGMGSVQRWRLDNLYRDLEGIIAILGTLRDERKSLVFVSDSMPGVGGQRGGGGGSSSGSSMPQGQPPISRPMPGATGLSLGTYNPTQGVDTCALLARDMPFQSPDRYDDLIRLARRMNVAIHPVSPMGLTASSSIFSGSALRRLADETGGIAVVNVNDIDAGLKKIVNDMPAYYLLGYHTTNTKWDGRRREIKVRLKSTGKTVRARREYLAPSAADMAAIRAAADAPPRPAGPTPIERALGVLARLRGDAEVHLQGAVREGALAVAVEVPSGTAASGGWYEGADVEVFAMSESSPSSAAGPSLAGMTGNTKMRPGARGAEVRLPIAAGDAGPWQVRVLVKHADATLEDRARVVLDPATPFGEPLLYRAASPPAAPYVPVADRQFQRNERMRVEWLVSSPTPIRLKARLLQTTGTPLTYAPPVVSEERGGATLARVDMTMTSIAAGDYLIELVAESNGEERFTLLAIRVLR